MADIQRRFEAAVNVIKSLPKDGPYQPSNEMLLKFYSYFKQATEGTCRQAKPAFWEPIKRAKWDAWHKLGDMSREEAMGHYVDELKSIIETMALTDSVAEFIDHVGPFYELVDLNIPALKKFARSRSASPSRADREPVLNGDAELVDGAEEEETPPRDPVSDGVDNVCSEDSENDEFADPIDEEVASQDDVKVWSHRNGQPSNSDRVAGLESGLSPLEARGGNDPGSGIHLRHGGGGQSSSVGGGAVSRNPALMSVHSAAVQQWSGGSAVSGGDGGRRGGPSNAGLDADMNEQIAATLLQLQHDMESVLSRLNTLEALTVAQHQIVQEQRMTPSSSFVAESRGIGRSPSHRPVRWWWPFSGLPLHTVLFVVGWPVALHLILAFIRYRRERRRLRS